MRVDVAIIGGGIAGLSCAAEMGPHTSTVVIEAAATPGYHATGRSAALYTEHYGAGVIRNLARASRAYYTDRYPELSSQLGLIFVAPAGDEAALAAIAHGYGPLGPSFSRISGKDVEIACPLLSADAVAGGFYEPGALNLDVDGLQTSYVGTARHHGVTFLQDARITSIQHDGPSWLLESDTGATVRCDTIVNAAGAWGDVIATLAGVEPLGLTALARSVFTFDPQRDNSSWPMIVDARERWYMKPEGPHMLASAASELEGDPRDAKADELDIALGIERLNSATTLQIRSVKNTWAGLRTFTSDRIPAVGRDHAQPDFFWLVGQGGYGIKTSPALGRMAAGLLLNDQVPDSVSEFGVTREDLDPRRLRP